MAMQSKDPENQIDQTKPSHSATKEQRANHNNSSDDPASDGNCDDQGNINSKMIDLNMRPAGTDGQGSNSQVCHICSLCLCSAGCLAGARPAALGWFYTHAAGASSSRQQPPSSRTG